MKIRWTGPNIQGMFHNNIFGVHRGQIIDTDDGSYDITEASLDNYLATHWAESVWATRTDHDSKAEHEAAAVEYAVAQEHEKAALEVPPEPEPVVPKPKPLDEDDEDEPDEPPSKRQPVKRRPGR